MTSPSRLLVIVLDETATFAAVLSGVSDDDALTRERSFDGFLNEPPVGHAEDRLLVCLLERDWIAAAELCLVPDDGVDAVEEFRVVGDPAGHFDPRDLAAGVDVAEPDAVLWLVAAQDLRFALEGG